ncbi:hypothetical protein E3Q05_00793 [Wallemia mellicola]|nr:hypothetical protein E3Q05_00793 [Wallemia mellicola]
MSAADTLKKETTDEDIQYSSGSEEVSEEVSEVEQAATEAVVSPNQTVEVVQPVEPSKKNVTRKQRKKSAPTGVTDVADLTKVLNTAGQVIDTATKTIKDPQEPSEVIQEAQPTKVVQPIIEEGLKSVVQTGKKADGSNKNNPISLRLDAFYEFVRSKICTTFISHAKSDCILGFQVSLLTVMAKEKGKEVENIDVSRVDRGLMESYAELGRQAIGSTHTDLTADKHGGPIEQRRESEDEDKDYALGLRLDLNLAKLHGDVVLTRKYIYTDFTQLKNNAVLTT